MKTKIHSNWASCITRTNKKGVWETAHHCETFATKRRNIIAVILVVSRFCYLAWISSEKILIYREDEWPSNPTRKRVYMCMNVTVLSTIFRPFCFFVVVHAEQSIDLVYWRRATMPAMQPQTNARKCRKSFIIFLSMPENMRSSASILELNVSTTSVSKTLSVQGTSSLWPHHL